MRIVYDHSPGAYAVSVPCLACGKMVRLADAAIDAHGPAFRAYYHEPACAPDSVRHRCTRDGCTRCVGLLP